ncbi:MAG: DedA family protein [Vicinamibacterales bacterium]
MDYIRWLIDFTLHIDRHLGFLIASYGTATYGVLFAVVFLETGLVVTPFLPGDSLLFAAGTFSAVGSLDVWFLYLVLTAAAVLGDTINYSIGHYLGPRVFHYPKSRFFNPDHLRRTQQFFERYGAKTIVIARFVPIVRTFAPFVAGIGKMRYLRFVTYNVAGGAAWVAVCLFSGYLFGNLPIVQENFGLVILAIIFVSVLPGIVGYLRERKRAGSL